MFYSDNLEDNPFEFGHVLGGDELVDRTEEVGEVMRTIRDGGKLFLIGPRRFGKTSVLVTAAEKLEEKKGVVISLNAEAYPSLDLLVRAIVSAAAKNLTGEVRKVGGLIQQVFSRLRPELEYNVAENTWSAKLGVERSAIDHTTLLVEALDSFERLAQSLPEKRPVGLILDEFQKVIELGGSSAEGQIRAAIQKHKRAGYVFAGSKTHFLAQMTSDPKRPFYRLGSVRFLGPVPRKDFLEFLEARFSAGGLYPEVGAMEHLIDVCKDVPYNVQMLAHNCWSTIKDSVNRHPLNKDFIDEMVKRVVMRQDPYSSSSWNDLTAVQQKTLLAVIQLEGKNLQSKQACEIVGKLPATIRRSIELMTEKGILREEEKLNSVRLVFEDPFFEKWIQLVIPF